MSAHLTAGDGEPPLPLRQRQQLRTRQDLVQASIDVIAANGLEKATIERITARSGVSRATLYAHFPGGRSDLIAAAYSAVGEDLIEAAERDAARQEDWVDRLCAYPRAMLDLAARPQLSLFYNVSGPQQVGIGKRRGSASQRSLDAFVHELTQAQERDQVRSGIDVEAIAGLLIGAIREAGIDASRDPSSASRNLDAFRQLLQGMAS